MNHTAFFAESLLLIGSIQKQLMACNLFMGTAESCTGGLAAVLCTDVPGSSRWFRGGIIAYSNVLKERLLGVPPALLEAHGAVSEAVVKAMAQGALDALHVDVGLALSGVAGPDGGTAEKPVGTVWTAVAVRMAGKESLRSCRSVFPGDRAAVRARAAIEALKAVDEALAQSKNETVAK